MQPVEECAVVESLSCKLEEVLAVQGSVVGEGDTDFAHVRFDADDVTFLLGLGFGREDAKAEEDGDDEELVIMFHSV